MAEKGKSQLLAEGLRRRILSGELPEGYRFDTIPKFASQNNTTVATIGKVFGILENGGLVERINGRGVFVRKHAKKRFAVIFDTNAEYGVFAHKAVFMRSFMEECRKRNADYEVFENVDSAEDCGKVRKALLESPFDEAIVCSRGFAEGIGSYLKAPGIPSVGLYPYRWMEKSVSFSGEWILAAGGKLKEAGCVRACLITARGTRPEWTDSKGHMYYFSELCREIPELFRKEDVLETELSPRGGYAAAGGFLDSIRDLPGKTGLISDDSILTHGVISAVLQRGMEPMRDIWIISHANRGAVLSEFPLSVWKYEADISLQAAKMFDEGFSGRLELPLNFQPE